MLELPAMDRTPSHQLETVVNLLKKMDDNLPITVHNFIDQLKKCPRVEKIVLFGSRAVGDFEPRADIDIAISAPALSKRQFAHIRRWAYEYKTLYWITLVHLERIPIDLRERINRQGVLIYEQEKDSR